MTRNSDAGLPLSRPLLPEFIFQDGCQPLLPAGGCHYDAPGEVKVQTLPCNDFELHFADAFAIVIGHVFNVYVRS